jgi:hypothetical protein
MRSHLSALPVEDRVREQMIAHSAPGIHAVYDRHKYTEEKQRGFALWEARLHSIPNPKPTTTVADARRKRLPAA